MCRLLAILVAVLISCSVMPPVARAQDEPEWVTAQDDEGEFQLNCAALQAIVSVFGDMPYTRYFGASFTVRQEYESSAFIWKVDDCHLPRPVNVDNARDVGYWRARALRAEAKVKRVRDALED